MSKPRRPEIVNYLHRDKPTRLIEIFEDHYAEQFADPGDIQVTRTPVLFGDIHLFEDIPYDQQADFSRKIAKFLTQYASWIETRKLNEDPNG